MVAGVTLHFRIPEGYTLALMLIITLVSYLTIRKNYGWANGWLYGDGGLYPATADAQRRQFIVPRFIDTVIGCLIAFGGMVWLWPQWQSGLLRKNAHDALEADQEAIRLILSNEPAANAAGVSANAGEPGAQYAV